MNHCPITASIVIGKHPDGTAQHLWTEGHRVFIEGYGYAKAKSGISYGAIQVREITPATDACRAECKAAPSALVYYVRVLTYDTTADVEEYGTLEEAEEAFANSIDAERDGALGDVAKISMGTVLNNQLTQIRKVEFE